MRILEDTNCAINKVTQWGYKNRSLRHKLGNQGKEVTYEQKSKKRIS